MKKQFITGFITATLIFGTVPAFANTVSSLIGAKVEGTYTVQKADGTKIADGAIINGSAYVPVRAIADATGTELTVKDKVITLGDVNSSNIDELNVQKNVLLRKIKETEGAINYYETITLPRAEERLSDVKGTDTEKQQQEWLDNRTSEYEQYKSDLADLKKQLTEIEAQITGIQK